MPDTSVAGVIMAQQEYDRSVVILLLLVIIIIDNNNHDITRQAGVAAGLQGRECWDVAELPRPQARRGAVPRQDKQKQILNTFRLLLSSMLSRNILCCIWCCLSAEYLFI